jgi:hypothetical protein
MDYVYICILYILCYFDVYRDQKNLNIKYTGAEFGLGHCLAL